MRLLAVAAGAAALGFVCPAFADVYINAHERSAPSAPPPAIVVQRAHAANSADADIRADIQRVSLVERVGPERTHAVLTIVIATASTRAVEASLPLELPRDARATGMVVTLGGQHVPGVAISREDAYDAYTEFMPERIDPAILSLDEVTETTQVLELRAWPVSKAHTATVAIDLELPTGTVIAVEKGVGVTPRVKQTKITTTEEQASHSVDRTTSLYAGPPRVKMFAWVEPHDMVADRDAGAHEPLTREDAQHLVMSFDRRLRACFAAEGKRTGWLVGRAELGFEVTKTGEVGDIDVTAGDHARAVRTCIRDHVARWRFPASDDVSRVSYTTAAVLR